MRKEDCGICVFLRMPFPSYRTEKTIKPLQASKKTALQLSVPSATVLLDGFPATILQQR